MLVSERTSGDRDELRRRIGSEKNAKQRDRLRAVALALGGQEAPRIARMLGRSRRFVQEWVYVYRDAGLEAVKATPQTGQPVKLAAVDETLFKTRMLAGPVPADEGLCTLRGKDAQRILHQEFGVKYTLSGAYKVLHRLGFSYLQPRPRHRKNDPQVMAQWLAGAPLLSTASGRNTLSRPWKSGSRTKPGSASRER
jgi:Transposase and inactivated derivatives